MRLIQFELPGQGRRVGLVEDERVIDLTAARPELRRTIDVCQSAWRSGHFSCSTLPIWALVIGSASISLRPALATLSRSSPLK